MGLVYQTEDCTVAKPVGKFLSIMNPYKRSEYARKLINSVQDSMEIKMSPISSPKFGEGLINSPSYLSQGSPIPNLQRSFDDLERLYPTGDNLKTIGTIMKCRIEHDARAIILRGLRPVVLPVVKHFFARLSEYGNIKSMYKRTLAATTIPNIIIKVLQRFHVVHLSFGFQSIRSFSDKILMADKEHHRNLINIKIKRDEAAKGLGFDLGKIIFKRLQYAINIFKNIELRNYQMKNGLLGFKQILSALVYTELKDSFSVLKLQNNKFIKRHEILNDLDLLFRNLKIRFAFQNIIYYYRSHKSLEKSVTFAEKMLKRRNGKMASNKFNTWKRIVLIKQGEIISRRLLLENVSEAACLRLNFMLRRTFKDGYNQIKEYAKFVSLQKKYRYGLLLLFSSLRKVINLANGISFCAINNRQNNDSISLLYVLRAIFTSRLSGHLHSIMSFYRSTTQKNYVQFALTMQKLSEKSKYKKLLIAWNRLKPLKEIKIPKLSLKTENLFHSRSNEYLNENIFLSPISNGQKKSLNSPYQTPHDIFASLHSELTERELEQLEYISPSESNSFIPMNSEESTPSTDRNQALGIYFSAPLEIPSSPRNFHYQQSSAVQTSANFPEMMSPKRRVNSEQAFYKPLIVKNSIRESKLNDQKKAKFIVKKTDRPP